MEGGTAIDVHVNKLYDAGASSHADPGERGNLGVVQRRKGPSRCLPCTALLVERWVCFSSRGLSDGRISFIEYHSLDAWSTVGSHCSNM